MEGLSDFFAVNIFGQHRYAHLGTMLTQAEERAVQEHQDRIDAVRRVVEDIEDRRRRLVQNLELMDGDADLMNDIRQRSAELSNDRNTRIAQLERLEQTMPARPEPELLDLLPAGPVRLDAIPEALQRKLFEAFRLQIRYDWRTNTADCRITLTAATIQAQQRAAQEALTTPQPDPGDRAPAPMLCVPPRGYTKHWRTLDAHPADGLLTISRTFTIGTAHQRCPRHHGCSHP